MHLITKCAIDVFVDLKKVFDTVDYDILAKKNSMVCAVLHING